MSARIRRVLNSFLQMNSTRSAAHSLVIAATNHPGILDLERCFRRFDDILHYELPELIPDCAAPQDAAVFGGREADRGGAPSQTWRRGLSYAEGRSRRQRSTEGCVDSRTVSGSRSGQSGRWLKERQTNDADSAGCRALDERHRAAPLRGECGPRSGDGRRHPASCSGRRRPVSKSSPFRGALPWTEWNTVVDAWQLASWEDYRDVQRLGRKTRHGARSSGSCSGRSSRGSGLRLAEQKRLTEPGVFARPMAAKDGRGRASAVRFLRDRRGSGHRASRSCGFLAADWAGAGRTACSSPGISDSEIFQTPFDPGGRSASTYAERSHTLRIQLAARRIRSGDRRTGFCRPSWPTSTATRKQRGATVIGVQRTPSPR